LRCQSSVRNPVAWWNSGLSIAAKAPVDDRCSQTTIYQQPRPPTERARTVPMPDDRLWSGSPESWQLSWGHSAEGWALKNPELHLNATRRRNVSLFRAQAPAEAEAPCLGTKCRLECSSGFGFRALLPGVRLGTTRLRRACMEGSAWSSFAGGGGYPHP
jgi:hypothetical protein